MSNALTFSPGDTTWSIKRKQLARLNTLSMGEGFAVGDSVWAIERKCLGAFNAMMAGGFMFPIPTGFIVNSNIHGTTLLSNWFTAPAGVTGTEVWTSTDGVNYTLAATVAQPTSNKNFPGLSVGQFQWIKIRWTNGAGGFSDFTPPQEFSGQAMDWAARVNTNVGLIGNIFQIKAVNDMWCTLVNGGVSSHIIVLNPIAGIGDLITTMTPLITGPGTDPWGNHNANNTDSTVNGLVCAGSMGLLPGFAPTSFASDSNAGISVYDTGSTDDGNNYVYGGYNGGDGIMSLHTNSSGRTQYDCFSLANRVSVAAQGAGFYSVNRVASNDLRLFFGNSGSALSQVGSTSTASGGTRESINIGFGGLCQNNVGNISLFTGHTLSFFAAHDGLSLAQATTLFNAVQTMRVALGGGFV